MGERKENGSHCDNFRGRVVLELTREVKTKQQGFLRATRRQDKYEYPVVMIESSMTELGTYNPNTKTIVMNGNFIEGHAWYAVLDVLYHELAHHLKKILFPKVDETPHGQKFREICVKLGANPEPRANYEPLDNRIMLDDASAEAQMTPMELRIQKLLALSESPNVNEAHEALMKARELMARYGVEVREREREDDPFVTVNVPEHQVWRASLAKRGNSRYEERYLAAVLGHFYNVVTVFTQEPIFTEEQGERMMTSFSGRRSQVKIALYVRDYIAGYIWRSYQSCLLEAMKLGGEEGMLLRMNLHGRKGFRDYAIGVLDGIFDVLKEQEKLPEIRALIVADPELQKYVHAYFPNLRHMGSHSLQLSPEVHQAGLDAGHKITISPGVGGDSSSVKKLPGGH